MADPANDAPEPKIVIQTVQEICLPVIHHQTAFAMYVAAVAQGLCASRNPCSKEDAEEIVTMTHFLANRLIAGPQQ